MNRFDKSFDYFRKLYRSGTRISALQKENCYWLIDGYVAHKIPELVMELNPEIFKEVKFDFMKIVKKAEAGIYLKETGLVKHSTEKIIIPFVSEQENPFTIWFSKTLLDSFPKHVSLYGTGPIDAASVKDGNETIGIILPVRNPKDDITPFI